MVNVTATANKKGDKIYWNVKPEETPESAAQTAPTQTAAPQQVSVPVQGNLPESPRPLFKDLNAVAEARDQRIAKESIFSSLCRFYAGKDITLKEIVTQADVILEWVNGAKLTPAKAPKNAPEAPDAPTTEDEDDEPVSVLDIPF